MRLGLTDPWQCVLHLPLRYEDESRVTPIGALVPGDHSLTEGRLVHGEVRQRPRRQWIGKVRDEHGDEITVRLMHFSNAQLAALPVGSWLRLYGEVRGSLFGREMIHPRMRASEPGAPTKAGLTAVYPTVAGVAQPTIRRAVAAAFAEIDWSDTLSAETRARLGLPALREALARLHYPLSIPAGNDPAWQRVRFDELLAQRLSLRLARRARAALAAAPLPPGGTLIAKPSGPGPDGLVPHRVDAGEASARGPTGSRPSDLVSTLVLSLPFPLTGAQQRAWAHIAADLARPQPMQRLLQGDVGAGKTIVAAMACLRAVENARQAAVMAPTELLAEQHLAKFRQWLEPLGVRVAGLSGGQKKAERERLAAAVAAGEVDVVVGTHALFQKGVDFRALALVVVDEQHRFGVAQRLSLSGKGAGVHSLMMSATPIPRTLAMSYYADLDVSVIDELPPGRSPIETRVIGNPRRAEVVEKLARACADGHQLYWVCPLVDESEALQLRAATEAYEELRTTHPEVRFGLVHGRLAAAEKAAVMGAFQRHEIDWLVATTVIEVGVDVPNATWMVIEHAERLGLAQLHQLRGRVGRGPRQSHCILLFEPGLSENARRRLEIIRHSTDGFEIARRDLELRGPGELLGKSQSGQPLLRFADPERDADLLEQASRLADEWIARADPMVPVHLDRWLGERQG
ncbi:MAG: ATP-dependent DNA helicase RecG, partial [Rhodocyclaceae bacterium]|nr:ATP-dependent DNA helicase RecG [Rhodocyclaceae bacterium]